MGQLVAATWYPKTLSSTATVKPYTPSKALTGLSAWGIWTTSPSLGCFNCSLLEEMALDEVRSWSIMLHLHTTSILWTISCGTASGNDTLSWLLLSFKPSVSPMVSADGPCAQAVCAGAKYRTVSACWRHRREQSQGPGPGDHLLAGQRYEITKHPCGKDGY